MVSRLKKDLAELGRPDKEVFFKRFFKTGQGEYGEGDKFLGITVPVLRSVARKYQGFALSDIRELLESPVHEHRFVALEILVMKYEQSSSKEQQKIVDFYLRNSSRINNWDLVDTSAPYILGDFLLLHSRKIIYSLARSKDIWKRRISIIATLTLIKKNEIDDTLKIAEILIKDDHDLIHKATGWMLREVGKQNERVLRDFLDKHAAQMPRTMLRYSIEKLSFKLRKKYLNL